MSQRSTHEHESDTDPAGRPRPTGSDPYEPDRGRAAGSAGESMRRRTWLATLGACLAAPGVATKAAADDQGYGGGGWGDGGFGDSADDDTDDEPDDEEHLVVDTREASSVDDSSATLAGDLLELEGLDATTVSFRWGKPGDGFPNIAGEQTLNSPGEFDAEVTGLEDDTDYEFYAYAEADDTTDAGDTLTFTTAPSDEEDDDDGDEKEPSEDDLEAVPEITELRAEDVSNPRNPHVDAEVEWVATIEEGELAAAELTISDADGVVVSEEYDLDGQTAERTEEERIKHGSGETYSVELTVHSAHDTTETDETTTGPQ